MRKSLELQFGCIAKAYDNEPTFVLLARDTCAPATIRAWCAMRVDQGKNTLDDKQISEAKEIADLMELEQAGWYLESHKDQKGVQ